MALSVATLALNYVAQRAFGTTLMLSCLCDGVASGRVATLERAAQVWAHTGKRLKASYGYPTFQRLARHFFIHGRWLCDSLQPRPDSLHHTDALSLLIFKIH